MKTLGIIGLVVSVLSWICIVGFNNPVDYEAGLGWGIIAVLYLIALSIVAIVKSKDLK